MLRRREVLATGLVAAGLFAACEDDTVVAPPARVRTPLTCTMGDRAPGKYRITPAYPALTFQEATRIAVAKTGRVYVAERLGKVHVFDDRDDVKESRVFADLGAMGKIYDGDVADGIMGFALHPRFAETGEVFFVYTEPRRFTGQGARFNLVIARGRSLDGGLTMDPSTLETVLAMPRFDSMHHGGDAAFGPDGMLYVTIGDGETGDPDGHAQNKASLRGKVLRLDVSQKPYAVPPDNPFVGESGAEPEIWAYGFRNPWTFSFDRVDGTLWLGDVGHSAYEEIDAVVRGGNYGWRTKEGAQCFRDEPCDGTGMIDPVYQYSHREGFSVTVGIAYHGTKLPNLRGTLLFADFVLGRIQALHHEAGTTPRAELVVDTGLQVASFAEDRNGEPLFSDYANGKIQRIEIEPTPAVIPPRLSETGCFDLAEAPSGAIHVADNMFPYDVNMELWSDGATKDRWLSLPAGSAIGVYKDGTWFPPDGTIAWKTFRVDGRPVETRMLVNHAKSGWVGYSYAWDADGKDATLLEAGETRDVGNGKSWTYPSRSDCFACHTMSAGARTLGLSTAQLNRPIAGTTTNQVDALIQRGGLDLTNAHGATPVDALPRFATRDGDVAGRARAYLQVNCASCHHLGGPAAMYGDFRFAMSDASFCATTSEGARFVVPGDPGASAIVQRMRTTGPQRMPPLASAIVHDEGVAWVEAWIASLPPATCAP